MFTHLRPCYLLITTYSPSEPFRVFSYEDTLYTVVNLSNVESLPGIGCIDPQDNYTSREMRKALWATNTCPEMAYMLKRYDTESAFLARLNVDPKAVRIVKYDTGYMLNPEIQKSWYALENSLRFVSTALLNVALPNPEARFSLDSSFWPLPSERGYRKVHKSEYLARKAAGQSRDACALLVARCTLAIALVTTDPNANPPQWYQILTEKKVPPAWVDMLRDSVVADLSPGLRVGAFVSLVGPTPTAWINHIPCMIRANLPVYISWWPGPQSANVEHIVHEFPFLDAYRPSNPDPYVVPNEMESFFRWSEIQLPAYMQLPPIMQDSPLQIPCGQRQHPGESFFEFVTRRDKHYAAKEKDETPEHKAARLLRLAQAAQYKRPSRNTAVFLWMEVGDVDMTVPVEWLSLDFRALVAPSAVGEIWTTHPNSQKLYDAWRDEWDICVHLAPNDDVEDPWKDFDQYDVPVSHPMSVLLSDTSGVPAFEDDLQLFHGDNYFEDTPLAMHWSPNFERAHDLMFFRFGLIQAIAKGSAINYLEYDVLQIQKIFGMTDAELHPADIGLVQPLSALVTCFLKDCKNPHAPGLIWDLNPSCEVYLCHSQQKHPNILITKVMFNHTPSYRIRYDDPAEANCWWELLVDAVTAVELYRRRTIMCALHAVEFLVDRGIPFRTIFIPDQREGLHLCPPVQTVLGWRLPDFAPTSWDYREYERRVYALISQPKGRAALLRGGIVWRLAIEVLGGDWRELAKAGPSEDFIYYGQVFVPPRGDHYYDDGLSSDELDVICGVYKVYTASA